MRGELAEWSNAAVLKTVEVNSLLGFESLTLRQIKVRALSPVLLFYAKSMLGIRTRANLHGKKFQNIFRISYCYIIILKKILLLNMIKIKLKLLHINMI